MQRGQSERLVPMVQAAMAAARLLWSDLQALAVTSGPGGFTGVRIGLAAAQGLALAWDLPVIAVSAFAVLAGRLPPDERGGLPLVMLIEAKRAEVYVQIESPRGEALAGPALLDEGALLASLPPGPLLLAGDAAAAWLPHRW